jgi:hypothetical protein
VKVDFLVIGAQKSGTTALNRLLRQHPGLGLAEKKEVHFFDRDALFAGGDPDWAEYHAHFVPGAGDGRVWGENTPVYLYWEPVAERIVRYNPAMRLLAVLRDPVDRAFSHWQMTTRHGEETLPFGEAVRREAERCAGALPGQHRFWSYVDRGRYAGQIERYRRWFPAEQMLVLRSEELRDEPEGTFERVADFLGVERRRFRLRRKPVRVRYTDEMAAEDRAYLRGVFAPEVAALERVMGWKLAGWRG